MAASAQGKRIGILGGSFNPAHEGHVCISEESLKLLGLDEIWWLVAKQNPLKSEDGMLSFAIRFSKAQEITKNHHSIYVSDFEEKNGTIYIYDSLISLKEAYPDNNFVWIMGADNLIQFPKWYKWREIIKIIPMAIFNRNGYKENALSGEFANEFAAFKLDNPLELTPCKLPAWVFLDIETPKISASEIREL